VNVCKIKQKRPGYCKTSSEKKSCIYQFPNSKTFFASLQLILIFINVTKNELITGVANHDVKDGRGIKNF